MPKIELKISWSGQAPGVPEHRLSIGGFGPALSELLRAYRRIASNMMRVAAYAESGRLKELANRLDIEIETVAGTNPLELTTVCTFDAPRDLQPPLFIDDIPERASKELLDSILDESKGRPRNSAVRSYLGKLPVGLARQTYELHDNGNILHEPVIIEDVNLVTPTIGGLPYLIEFEGNIVGVGFDPGINRVRVKAEEDTLNLNASAELVETALNLRGIAVRGIAVRHKETTRLLRLSPLNAEPFTFDDQTRDQYVFQRWNDLLTKLAQ
jgi:hypothetical protein